MAYANDEEETVGKALSYCSFWTISMSFEVMK